MVEISFAPEIKEHIGKSQTVERANTYRTRGEPYTIAVDGKSIQWHSVKGGVNPEAEKYFSDQYITYELLFASERQQWLKIVPPELKSNTNQYDIFQKRLQKSVDIGQRAVEIAGVPELAEQFTEHTLHVRNKDVYGFITPHIGASVQYYLAEINGVRGKPLPEDRPQEQATFSAIYDTAFHQAVDLYLTHGYWMPDPNPGNILLHEKDGKTHVILIDFSNTVQEITRTFAIPEGVVSEEARREKVNGLLFRNIKKLYANFEKHALSRNIPFSPDLDVYKP